MRPEPSHTVEDAAFIVRWLDGREEPADIAYRYDRDYADQWAEQRDRGAVGLLEVGDDGSLTWRDHNYTEAALAGIGLEPGARVRHKRTGLVGTVQGFEYHDSGRLSGMPLRVYWDGDSSELGWFAIYPSPESLELLADRVPA